MNLRVATAEKKQPILLKAVKYVSVIHRWLGIALCLVMALWFATGSVLSFVPFPSLGATERIAGSEVINPNRIRVEPVAALAIAGTAPIDHLRLISVQGQPRYVLSENGQPVIAVSAEDGRVSQPISRDVARAVAQQFSGLKVAALEGPFDFDQWTVHGAYDAYRPFYKLSLDDAAGTALYVSLRSGEVVQRTRRTERAWNYVGAVVHWINPTILRKNYAVWRRVVWILALCGMTLVLAGIILGLVRTINLKRRQRRGLSPFSGWLRWHHAMGLFAGVLVLSWVSTGWLSLDMGTFFSSNQPSVARVDSLRGMPLSEAARAFPIPVLKKLGVARELEFTAVAAQPLLLLRNGGQQSSLVVSIDTRQALQIAAVVPDSLLLSAVQAAWPSAAVLRMQGIATDDAYNLRITPLPATARRIVLNDATETWVQVDAATGQIISVLDTSRRVYRWLVDGLHSFDFPLLNRAGSLWHVLLLLGTTTGFVFSCTGIVLGVKRLRR